MKEIRCENERYNKYFCYKGDTYTEKTEVKLTQDYIDTHVGEGVHEGRPIWKFAWFSNKKDIDGKTYYVFFKYKYNCNCKYEKDFAFKCAGWILIKEEDLESAIEEIVKPIPIIIRPMIKMKDWQCPEVMVLWVIYIFLLFASLILKEYAIAWFWETVFFFILRRELLFK